jgi:NADH-quinone oxidoreductase subunit E
MLSKEEINEINKETDQYPVKRIACIEALKIVQKHRRWVPDDAIKDLAIHLEMSAEEVDSIATFYNLIFRKPVGRNVILICDSVSCWLMGYESILEYLKETLGIGLGETTEDDRFTLLPIPCLGTCDHAPALMINNDLHSDLTPEKIKKILENYK